MSNCILFRVDGNARIGSGHVMRCLALAQNCRQRGYATVFAQAESTPALEQSLRDNGMELRRLDVHSDVIDDAAETARLGREYGATWIVADGYGFDSRWQRRIKDESHHLLLWDDFGHADHYFADLVLNQNLNPNPNWYNNREPNTRLLLGTQYVQLRREFMQVSRKEKEIVSLARKILVALGGGDADNATGYVLRAISNINGIEAVLVIGGSNPNLSTLQAMLNGSNAKIHLVVDAKNMPELMDWADVAISAGGSTCWEIAYMGLPSMMVTLARNQVAVAKAIAQAGVSINLGERANVSIEQIANELGLLLRNQSVRKEMSRRGCDLVDGLGGSRVVMKMRESELILRRANANDCRLVWEWSNEKTVRVVSFCPNFITWDEHVRWFSQKISDTNCYFYMASVDNGQLIGQIRFDLAGKEATVSISLAPLFRGKGLGSALISIAVKRLFEETNAKNIHAFIKPENEGSMRMFIKSGFIDAGIKCVNNQNARHFIIQSESP